MRPALRRIRSRRALWALGLAMALVLLASPVAHADIWANIGPASELGGLKARYPLGNYALDEHFTAISAGVFSGVDASGLLPMIAYFFANLVWQGTAWLANILIELFAFAFSLDLVSGSGATGGAGALGPVSRAIHSIYRAVFGGPWMVLAVSVAGCWAMWQALVQRRYSETAGRLALSLIYVAVALLFVWQPAQTIGVASRWTNEMSGAFLSIAKDGAPGDQQQAKQAGADQLFGLLVAEPWSVLQFGGLEHCVGAGGGDEPESVAVQPLPAQAARRLEAGEEVSAGGKQCVNDLKKYGDHFLRFAPGSDERDAEFEALSEGDSSKLPDADPSSARGDYRLGPADEPAAAAMEEGGQYQRLLVAIVIFCAELGAFLLLGALSVGVILAQVLLLLLLAFSPVALVAAAIPGRGHQFFKAWLQKLAGYLLRKAAYSLVLAILLALCAAISAATSQLGWLFSFGMQCAFFWAVFLQRRSLTDGLVGVVTGPGAPGRERALGVLALYYGARGGAAIAARPLRAAGRGARSGAGHARRRLRGGSGAHGHDSGTDVAPPRAEAPTSGQVRRPGPGHSDPATAGAGSRPGSGRRRPEPEPRAARRNDRRTKGESGEAEGARELGTPRGSSRRNQTADPSGRKEAADGSPRPGPAQDSRDAAGSQKGDPDDGKGARPTMPKERAAGRRSTAPKPTPRPRPAFRPTAGQSPSSLPAETRSELSEELRAERERAAEATEHQRRAADGGPRADGRSQPPAEPSPPPRAPAGRGRRFGRGPRGAKGRRFGKGGALR